MPDSWPDRRIRHGVRLKARVVDGDGGSRDTFLVDLSLDGCKLVGEYRIGEQLEIRLERIGPLKGVVRWSFGGRSGVRFLQKSAAPSA